MQIKNNYNHTIYASYIGYITQAIVVNFAPLLFLTFHHTYHIPMERITLLISINFAIQLVVDLAAAKFADKIGYKPLAVIAHVFIALGLAGLGVFPRIFPDPYSGIFTATAVYAIGGGLIEVLISPIVEACPTEGKSASMSLLHSFYCWGHVFVVLFSTAFFYVFGIENWIFLALIWAAVPLFNAFYFSRVPVFTLTEEGQGMPVKKLLSLKLFWILALLMVCSGAAEQAMNQWASVFAESGLGVPKAVGDLAGPCMFAALMGVVRVIYSRFSKKFDLRVFMVGGGFLCLAGFLLAALSPYPVLSLVGCGLCGLSVGIMWPGTLSLASAKCPTGGTAMFAILALAGDLGCSIGPATAGMAATLGSGLKTGFIAAAVFPVLLIAGLVGFGKMAKGR